MRSGVAGGRSGAVARPDWMGGALGDLSSSADVLKLGRTWLADFGCFQFNTIYLIINLFSH
ncbi:hypothetical protein RchiOBHm_Chr4g0412671 [Rosa chinensis]|uniref:Uncharacterized protein n=1 Tax=Rosa chinensis TaxID=74649 RepID=A0A2P6QVV9_ROSCH|nr:hypothetical protein RchiOBHm_Chr4g0412671 [Rosa chinensis]